MYLDGLRDSNGIVSDQRFIDPMVVDLAELAVFVYLRALYLRS
jgi:hypothetical protein